MKEVRGMGKEALPPPPFSSPVSAAAGKISLCFETKPLLATLLAVTLVMAIWNLQPYYQNLLPSSPPTSLSCHCSTTTAITTVTTSTPLNSTSLLSGKSQQSNSTSVLSGKTQQTTTPLNSTSLLSGKSQETTTPLNSTSVLSGKTQQQTTTPLNSGKSQQTTIPLNSGKTQQQQTPTNPDPNKREFHSYGNAAALFVQMGAYRGGPSTFSIIGLASKPLHIYGTPWFKCEWIPFSNSTTPLRTKAHKILPDWGYGRVYTVVVVNCTFPSNNTLTTTPIGGKLILKAHYSLNNPRHFERFTSLIEQPNTYRHISTPPQYSYLYCGSPLYGTLNPDRIREWVAYHTWFFGPDSHFVMYDAGGVSDDVREVLDPWVRKGRVTIQDVRGQKEFDGYYYNQFLIVNDCLHRYRFDAKWLFFFDVDEFIYLPDGSGNKKLGDVMMEFDGFTQFTIQQNSMSSALCLNDSSETQEYYKRQWGFEKLLFRDSRTKIRRDRKYAIQPRNAFATGVHMSENVVGKTLHKTETKIRYYHYHNTIQVQGEPCRVFLPPSAKRKVTVHDKLPFVYDEGMKRLADTVKRFEHESLGENYHQRS